MVRKKLGRGRKNRCRFCTKEGCPRPAFVDYKDVQTLKKLCTSQGKKNDVQVKRMVIEVMEDSGLNKVKTGWFSNWYAKVKKEVGL